MNALQKLQQRRADLLRDAQAQLAAAQAAGRPLTADEQIRDDSIHESIKAIDAQITDASGRRDREAAAALAAGTTLAADGSDPALRLDPRPAVTGAPGAGRGARFAELFGQAAAHDGAGFKTFDEFMALLHAGLGDPRLRATGTVGVPSTGGFAVPSETVATWLDTALEDEVVRPRATVYPMSGAEIKVPGWDATSHASTLYGAFAGGWVGEAAEITAETPLLRLVSLVAKKIAVLTEASNELVAGGIGYAEQLTRAIVKSIGWHLDSGFLTGTGAGQPLGVLNSSALISVDKEIGQAASTVNYHNLVKVLGRMAPWLLKDAVWVAHPSTIPQLSVLSLSIGTGGAHIPVMAEGTGSFTILTRPVIFSEKVPALGQQGDVGLYAFREYAVGVAQTMTLDRSSHVGFTRATEHFRGILRADGAPLWNGPLTLKGGLTVSPFVTIEART